MQVLFFILIIFLLTFAYAGLRGAPWVPTHARDVARFLNLADIRAGERIYDLGCGDARMLCAASAQGAQGIGFEISLLPYLLARLRLVRTHARNVAVRYQDFWNADLRDADVVYFFLMPKIYSKLKEKLERELKTGAQVIAYVWPIEGWEPSRIDRVQGQPALYLYTR